MKAFSGIIQRTFFLPLPGLRQLLVGNAGVQLVGLLAYPFLQHLYLPEAFGRLGLLSSLVVVLAVMSTLRLDAAIVLAKEKADDLAQLSLFLVITASLVLCLPALVYVFLPDEMQQKVWFLPWLPVSVFMLGLTNIVVLYLTHLRRFSQISKLRLAQKLVSLGFQIGVGFIFAHWWGLLVGFMMGLLMSALLGARHMPRIKVQLNYWKGLMKEYRDFIQWGLPQSLLDVFSSKLPFFILPFLFGYREAGWYMVAAMVLTLPEIVVGSSVGQAFYKQIVDHSERNAQWELLWNTWKKLALQGGLIFGSIGAGASLLLWLGFLDAWTGAAESILLLLPFFFLSYVVQPTSRALTVFRKQHLVLCFGVASVLMRPLMLLLGWWMGSYYLSLLFWTLFEIVQLSVYLRLVAFIAKRRCFSA